MSNPAGKNAFPGYQITQANFVQLPTEILWDTKDLTPELHHTLTVAAGKILWEQFRAGAARDCPIAIPLRWWMETLNLTANPVRTRLARLEELGRLVIKPNPDPQGGNLYGIRWASKETRTSFHAQRIVYRLADLKRHHKQLSATPLPPTEGGGPLPPTEPPPSSAHGTPPPSVGGTPSNKKVQDTDFNNLNPSVSQSSQDQASQDQEKPTDRRILGLLRVEGEPIDPRVLEALGEILDPPQIPHVEAGSVLNSKGLHALFESIRIHGKKLGNAPGVLWNAARDLKKAEFWILRVLGPLDAAEWYAQPGDFSDFESHLRRRILKSLGEIRLIPLDPAGQEQRKQLFKEQQNRETEWQKRLQEAEEAQELPEDAEDDSEALEGPPAPPVPVNVADFPAEQAGRLPGLIQAWRDATRKAWTSKPEERESLAAATRQAWDSIITTLEAIGPLIRADYETFKASEPSVKNITDIAKELQK